MASENKKVISYHNVSQANVPLTDARSVYNHHLNAMKWAICLIYLWTGDSLFGLQSTHL